MDTLSTLLEDVHLHETKYYRLKLGGGMGLFSCQTGRFIILFGGVWKFND